LDFSRNEKGLFLQIQAASLVPESLLQSAFEFLHLVAGDLEFVVEFIDGAC
jgi:hypothetical protein